MSTTRYARPKEEENSLGSRLVLDQELILDQE